MSLIGGAIKSEEKRILKKYENNLGYLVSDDYRKYGYNYRDLEAREMAILEEKIRIKNENSGILAPMFSDDEREER